MLTGGDVKLTPAIAWHEGTNIRKALNEAPSMIRAWVMSEVGGLIKELNAKTTISGDAELIFCCNSIMEEHPTLKLEELRECFTMVRKGKFGKMFERLKTPEILEYLRRYEGEVRVEIMERTLHDSKYTWQDQVVERVGSSAIRDVVEKVEVKDPELKGDGIGTRLRKKLDDYSPEE